MAKKTNCVKNGNQYYRVTLTLGIKANGKPNKKEFYGKTKAEAERKRDEYKTNLSLGIVDSDALLGNTFKTWLFVVCKAKVRPTSFCKYEGIYRNYILVSPLANSKIKSITSLQIQKYYNALVKEDKSYSQITNLNKLLKQFFKYCINERYIFINPCNGVVIPKEAKKSENEVVVFSDDEIFKLLSNNDKSKIKYIAMFSLATGMRKGEILGLKESDIDRQNREIHISQGESTTYIYDDDGRHKENIIQPPKTKRGKRSLPLTDNAEYIIDAAIKLKKIEMLKCKDYNRQHKDMIFLSENGNLLDASNVDDAWVSYLKRLGIPHKKFHALRHTYATIQFDELNLKVISELLGHSSIEITANIYTHVQKKHKEKQIDIVERYVK